MSVCYNCGVCEDYTDQFAVKKDGEMTAACWSCFKALGCPKVTEDVDDLDSTVFVDRLDAARGTLLL